MNNKSKFEYIKIPIWVFNNYQLSAGAKLLYSLILSLSKKDGYCYASNIYLSKLLAVSVRTVTSKLNELIEENLIEIENPRGRNRRLYIAEFCLYS